jgi:hypothetical protein
MPTSKTRPAASANVRRQGVDERNAMPDPFDYVADDIEEDWPASVDWDTVVGLILEYTVAE